MIATVLMSTYNGEKYIREQLDSIFSQVGVCVKLVVRDDGSSDGTVKILKEYQKAHPEMVVITDENNLRACGSFFFLIRTYTEGSYFALSDQDDIWDSDKLITAIDKIQQEEKKNPTIPLLYYSNLRIVNERNEVERISHSVPHIAKNRYACLIENLATGCTVVYNQKLAQIARDIQPYQYSMHDVWLYRVATLFGATIYDSKPHINYRQHTGNVVGASLRKVSWRKIKKELNYIFSRNHNTISINAKILYEEFNNRLTNEDRKKFDEILEYKKSLKTKLSLIFDRDLWSDSFYRNIVFALKVLLGTA